MKSGDLATLEPKIESLLSSLNAQLKAKDQQISELTAQVQAAKALTVSDADDAAFDKLSALIAQNETPSPVEAPADASITIPLNQQP